MIDIERFSEAARFARKSVENRAHLQPPKNSRFNGRFRDLWERNIDITLTYLFGMEEGKDNTRHLSLEDVGRIFFSNQEESKKRRELVRQIVKSTVFCLWQNSPQQLRNEYPLNRLRKQLGKPLFLTSSEGVARSVLEDWDKGTVDYESLRSKHSSQNLFNARKSLRGYGIVVSYEPSDPPVSKELEQVGPKTDNDALQQIFSKITNKFVQNHREIYDRHFISLSEFLRKIGFYFKNQNLSIFLNRLTELGIVVGHNVDLVKSGLQKRELHYYFVFRFQEESITQVLLADPSLARFLQNPVKQISGVRLLNLPNTAQLRNSGDYGSVLALCRQLGIRVGGDSTIKLDELFKDGSAPVFEYRYSGRNPGGKNRRNLYYSIAVEDSLTSFLLQRAADLGLVKSA